MSGENNTASLDDYSKEDTILLYQLWLMSFNRNILIESPTWVLEKLRNKKWVVEQSTPQGEMVTLSRLGERELERFDTTLWGIYGKKSDEGDTLCFDEDWQS